jgi:pimeloyl-CoA synthetase
MTNEEWVEELYHLADDIGAFKEMHPKIDELKKKHNNLNYIELVELAYIELKRKYEERLNDEDLIKKSYIKYAVNEITDNTMTQGEFFKKIVTDKKFRAKHLHE